VRSALVALAASVLLTTAAFPATIYVPDNYSTIQGAINASSTGDTIIVRPGTYVENIGFMGKAITLQSEQGAAVTIIDGSQTWAVVSFTKGEARDSVLDGFTLTNGRSYEGGGIRCDRSSPSIINNVITQNESRGCSGAGIHLEHASPLIKGNDITDNESDRSGGGIACEYSSPTIEENYISNNFCDIDAGGIMVAGLSSAEILKNTIVQNEAWGYGGGIVCSNAKALVFDNTIKQNRADDGAGGILCRYDAPIIFRNDISHNQTGGNGGAVSCSSDAYIVKNTIIWNWADGSGGGIYCTGNATINGNFISTNDAAGYWGGGISVSEAPNVINNIICNNRAQNGGGLSVLSRSAASILNNTIASNDASYKGGAIYFWSCSPVYVTNTILWDNDAPTGPECYLGSYNYATQVSMACCDIEGGQSSIYVDTNSTLKWGTGMIDADPLFADPGREDFHLTFQSPCVEAGESNAYGLPSEDFEDDQRIAWNRVDIGADEFYYHLYAIGSVRPYSKIDVKVVGDPSAPATLFLGSGIAEPPYQTQHGEFWLTWPPLWQSNTGYVPGSGILVLKTVVPSTWSSGSEHPLQALIGPWGGSNTHLSNLLTLVAE